MDWLTKNALSQDPNTSPEQLESLASDEEERIRFQVARNRSTPPRALQKLAHTADPTMRFLVAQHPSTPIETLEILAHDHERAEEMVGNEVCDVEVWVGVTRNPLLSKALLAEWAKSADPDLRKIAASRG
jgi:Leucine rich repeat variant